jgi:hypothetical protein
LDKKVLDWLLAGPAWLRYAVERQLLNKHSEVTPVLRDNAIQQLVSRLKGNDVGIPAIKTGRVHYTETGKAYWDLFFLADIGLSVKDLGLENEAEQIFRFQSADGSFSMPPNVEESYFCMSAILIASLAKMGYRDDPRVEKYIRLVLNSRSNDGGWYCHYYGYDPYVESCPMDNMNILMLLGQYDKFRESPQLHSAIDRLLEHWEKRHHLHGFGIGRRFHSLQYPAVKYGILRVLDVLSLYPYAVASPSFQSMLAMVHGKAADGRYFAETVDMVYTDFDFAQTSEPSRWLTFLVNRIDKRVEEAD